VRDPRALCCLQQVFLTADRLKAWGWRIPFAIGALLAIWRWRCGATCK
jgi:hypothetical protein